MTTATSNTKKRTENVSRRTGRERPHHNRTPGNRSRTYTEQMNNLREFDISQLDADQTYDESMYLRQSESRSNQTYRREDMMNEKTHKRPYQQNNQDENRQNNRKTWARQKDADWPSNQQTKKRLCKYAATGDACPHGEMRCWFSHDAATPSTEPTKNAEKGIQDMYMLYSLMNQIKDQSEELKKLRNSLRK